MEAALLHHKRRLSPGVNLIEKKKMNIRDRKEKGREPRGFVLLGCLSILSFAVAIAAIMLVIYANYDRWEKKQEALQKETVVAGAETTTEAEAEAEAETETVSAASEAAPDTQERKRSVEEHEKECGLNKGLYLLYEYEFRSKGPNHTKEEIEKYDIQSYWGTPSPNVSTSWNIEWPNESCGLTPPALAKVRRAILWMCFCYSVYFDVPFEALGETRESILARRNKIDASETNDTYLSHSDYARLDKDILSHKAGKKPGVEGDDVPTSCLELAFDTLKKYAQECSECQLTNGHICSQFTFGANINLSWPFGLKAKEDAAWYEKPVLCVHYWGWANDGGSGCHDVTNDKVYSLPEGEELFLTDYVAEDKLNAFKEFLRARIIEQTNDNYRKEWAQEKDIFEYMNDLHMTVNGEGLIVRWWRNEPEVPVSWKDLEPFRN